MKVQLAQIPCHDAHTQENLERVLSVIRASDPDTDLIVFPETCLMGFPTAQELAQVAEPEDGPTIRAVRQLVTTRGISVAVGFAEVDAGHYYNTTLLIGPDGIALKYRKTHLWGTDVGVFEPGDYMVTGLWRGIRVGIMICFDIEFPETARALAAQGAELLLVTNANMDPFGPVHRALIVARAMENQVFAVMTNRCGSGGDLVFAGESAVVSPIGKVLGSLGREESSLTVTLEMADVAKSRTDYHYLKQRRLPLAGSVVTLAAGQSGHRLS
ncbi:MAG: carbon-nitrogen hydrolase [Comamonadaceae bacterium CG1_02_60_18]|nr:MAG: carbon-nitrogen hydrolase [Comamonadaceae bacterium CG1_02_60_18]PIQ51497.1 MAG: carbon-nitrogen hydrolase [Comamonadaceae bacterium CG12_big_fil_rev_8_21_14_0_65_59_15]